MGEGFHNSEHPIESKWEFPFNWHTFRFISKSGGDGRHRIREHEFMNGRRGRQPFWVLPIRSCIYIYSKCKYYYPASGIIIYLSKFHLFDTRL